MTGARTAHLRTDEEFIEAVRTSYSIGGALKKLGMQPQGGSYRTFKARTASLNVDTSHFLGKRVSSLIRNKKFSKEEVFIENSNFSKIRKRVFDENIFPYKCSQLDCGLSEWKGKPLTLHLDHINGRNTDNRLENLRWLCPNCHVQTETYCVGDKSQKRPKNKYFCSDCKEEILYRSKRCKNCNNKDQLNTKATKITWPPIQEIIQLLKIDSRTKVAEKLGISDNAIRKHLIKRGIDPNTLKST